MSSDLGDLVQMSLFSPSTQSKAEEHHGTCITQSVTCLQLPLPLVILTV